MDTQNENTEPDLSSNVEPDEVTNGPEGQGQEASETEKQPSRTERRKSWIAEQRREKDDLRKALEARDAETRRLGEQVAEMRGRLEAQQKRDEPDPVAARLSELQDKAQRHLDAASTATDQATAKKELAAYHQALREANEVITDNKIAKMREEMSSSAMDPATASMAADLGGEFKWLRTNQSARSVADAFINEMISAGHPDGYETYRAACAKAAQVLNLGGTPARQPDKRSFVVPSGRNGAGGEHSSTPAMDRHQEIMAERLYPDLEPAAAHKKWAAGPGKVAFARMQQKEG